MIPALGAALGLLAIEIGPLLMAVAGHKKWVRTVEGVVLRSLSKKQI